MAPTSSRPSPCTFLIPIPLFIRLQMDTRHKVNLIILFAAGNFTVACSIIRMLQIKQVQKDGNNSMLLLWGSVEMNIGVSSFFDPPSSWPAI
jgi:hypothetical protein